MGEFRPVPDLPVYLAGSRRTTGRHTAEHLCSSDLYRGEFTVRDADHWRTARRVAGPAKDLPLTTDYARVG